jgi:hypothetical protein
MLSYHAGKRALGSPTIPVPSLIGRERERILGAGLENHIRSKAIGGEGGKANHAARERPLHRMHECGAGVAGPASPDQITLKS